MALTEPRAATRETVVHGNPSFALRGNIAFRVVHGRDRIIVRFGEFSLASKVLFAAIGAAGIGAVPILVHLDIAPLLAVLPAIGMLMAFLVFIVRQNEVKGIALQVEPKRCTLITMDREHKWEPVEQVLVINSHQFRDGSSATEGISEIFVSEKQESGDVIFYPLASGVNYGDYDDLARIIAEGAKVELRIENLA